MLDEVSELALFCAIAESGSLVGAGARLGLSGALVSKRLIRLEARLGVRLVTRTTRRLSLTAEGELYYQRGREALALLADTEERLRASRAEPAGVLRVTASASFGRQHIAPFLPAFLARYPALSVHLYLTDAVVDLVAERMDLAIRIGRPVDSDWVARRLADNRRVLCAAPDYLARRGVPQRAADLSGHDCLLLAEPGTRYQNWTLEGPSGQETVRVGGRLVCDHGEAVGEACAAGGGIAIKSVWDIGNALRAGRVVTVLPQYRLPAQDVYALYPQRAALPRIGVFVDYLMECYGRVPYWEEGL
ncbi:LysR family transcriptional regulator [Crenobacter sp. SG2303]|uniref:LysR family transcriptional regulator n=1 Tax=Crenobacter oryzisoli TaxID=3056844 RepID=A0ABT7XK80_9NEIS|nr:LysR family transcriptional regulator [Crenobacter sp. SG2303]MDN0074194.1 LysR family transcriptional regulator [Crenobacter sp. SG2303]